MVNKKYQMGEINILLIINHSAVNYFIAGKHDRDRIIEKQPLI
jgi:hypothetical protein